MEENMSEENEKLTGIFLEKDYAEIKKLAELEKSRNATKRILLKIIGVIVGVLILKNSVAIFEDIVKGQSSFWEFIQLISLVVLCACAIVSTIGEVRQDSRYKQKNGNIQTYLKVLRVYDKKELFQKLDSMNLKEIQKVFYDDNGNIGIQGRVSMHSFILKESPMVSFVSRKDNYRAAAEGETIVAALLKKLDPDVPINAYEIEKRNNLLIQQKKYLIISSIISGLLFVIIIFNPELLAGGNIYIEMVQDSHTDVYSEVSYGEAFNNYFTKPKWDYFESESGQQVVEFNGQCLYLNENADVTIQFLLTDLENENHEYMIEVCYLAINDIAQSELIKISLLADIFQNYYDTHPVYEGDI